MITLVVGDPGSGKSYYAVRAVAQAILAGRPVVTNVALAPGWEQRLSRRGLRRRMSGRAAIAARADLMRRSTFVAPTLQEAMRVRLRGSGEGRGLMVLDEVHEDLNARMWDTKVGMSRDEATAFRLDLVKFFARHRHMGFDVLLISQDEQNVDRQVRALHGQLTVLKNLRRFQIAGVHPIPVNLFLAVTLWNDKARTVLRRQVYGLDRTVASLYDTHALGSADVPSDVIWLPREAHDTDHQLEQLEQVSGPPPDELAA